MVAVEFNTVDQDYTRIIEFDMDSGKNFCYRGRTSYEAFANPLKGRYYNREAKLRYHLKRKVEFKWELRNWKRTMIRNPFVPDVFDIPTVKVGSLWEFYKLIGYDYKRKRYANPLKSLDDFPSMISTT